MSLGWHADKFHAHRRHSADARETGRLPLKAIVAVRYIPKFAVDKIMIARDHSRHIAIWSKRDRESRMWDSSSAPAAKDGCCISKKDRRSSLKKVMLLIVALLGIHPVAAEQFPLSSAGVKTLAPDGAIKPTGTWSLGTRAGDFVFVAGMRGIDPKTNLQIQGDEARIRQAFLNMKLIAESEGATLRDAVRLVVYVTDMYRFRPFVNKVQEELWGAGPYPPRTIVEVHRLNGDDICEVEGTFYAPSRK
jgi:2-iminobutanoate/2-iminopropanoate deaminase